MEPRSPAQAPSTPPEAFRFSPIVEPTARWIRVRFGGEIIADSRRALLLIEYGPGRLPTYCFPQADVRMEALAFEGPDTYRDGRRYARLSAGGKVAERGAWIYEDPPTGIADLKGYVTFAWDAMDAWYEEAEEIFVHARDPHKRVDVLASSRHVRLEVAGMVLAETDRPYLLFETNLPTRYYIPPEDIWPNLLEPTEHTSRCPYKGIADYYTARIAERRLVNVAWRYHDPVPECPKIRDLICFFNERVDIYVDGELQARPHTPWSE